MIMYLLPLGVLLLAVLLDLLIGDPRSAWHPVALIGRLISAWERLLYRQGSSPLAKRMAGALLVLGTLGALWLSGRVMRLGMLRFNQRLRLGEIFRRGA